MSAAQKPISRADFDAYNRTLDGITSGARRSFEAEMRAWLEANPGADVAAAREQAKQIMGDVAAEASAASSSLAAEWYDAQAEMAHAKLPHAVTVSNHFEEDIDRVARYQAGKLADEDVDGFVESCSDYLDYRTRLSLNQTIIANARRDEKRGVRYARVPTGGVTCAFCMMLASRGAVYGSRDTAGEMGQYHKHCDCKIVPNYTGDKDAEIVEGYDPKGLRDRMGEIERQTGLEFGSDRRQMDLLTRDLALRDPEWVHFGKIPEIGYSDDAAKAKKESDKDHAAEQRVADRIRKSGYRVVFVDDEKKYVDQETGRTKIRGYPDLDTGLEIKNVSSATSENTISKHIGKSKKKANLAQIVIDVSENENLTDEKAEEYVANSLRRHGLNSALLVHHDGTIATVYPKKRGGSYR